MLNKITPLLAILLVFWGCEPRTMDVDPVNNTMGFKPIYASSGSLKDLIKSTPPKALTETGKIYVKGNLLLVNKPYSGIHVIDNTDPAHPLNKSFLEIPGNLDVSMRGNYLYADYAGKIAVIDVTNMEAPKVTQSVELDTRYQSYPPQVDMQNSWSRRTFFECPDPSKGTVIAWTYTTLKSPKCWKDGL